MSLPIIDSTILNQAGQKLQDHEYTSLQLTSGDKKAQQMGYVILAKTGPSLRVHMFESAEARYEFISNQLKGFRQVV